MRIPILMYHIISKTTDRYEKRYSLSINNFKRQMTYLKVKGYIPISLDEFYLFFVNKKILPRKPIIITFDDGYWDTFDNALPVLREQNFKAAVFIVTGMIGDYNHWEMIKGYSKKRLVGWQEIDIMQRNGITIGSHTTSHQRLRFISPETARKEIEDSKKRLEDKLQMPICHFAYPHGEMNESIVSMVREAGYKTACSCQSGFNSEKADLLELRRIEIYGTDTLLRFAIKLTFGTNDGNLSLPMKYFKERLTDKILQSKQDKN